MPPRSYPRLAPLALAALPFVLVLALVVVAPGGPAAHAQASAEGPLPEGPGVQLVYATCQQCHPLRYVTESAGLPPFLWQDTIDLMQQLGMQVTAEEEELLFEYLSTYLGPNPPPATAAQNEGGNDTGDDADENAGEDAGAAAGGEDGVDDAAASEVDGAAVYSANCASCHGAEGGGVAGAFPPLVDHAPALFGADRDYLPQLLLYGLQGGIEVQGASYQGVMPAWAQLGDAEIAAVLNHTLTSWGNADALSEDAERYDASDVAAQRGLGLSAAEMLERRPALGE